MPPKTIGLIAHTGKPRAADLVNAVAEEFSRRSMSILIEKETARLAGKKSDCSITQLGAEADLLVVLGGDGTILHVVGQLGEVIKPIFGINVGSLGFLTCANSDHYREAVECIAKDRINFSQRTLLEARVKLGGKQTGKMTALNDVVLSRGELSRLVRLRTRVNGESLTEFNADGLIVATPTGSTAYSLSAGGPILDPESGVCVITPICPHVLTNRSIIVAETAIIEIEVSEPDYPVFLTVDGRDPVRIDFDSVVTIRKAKKTLPLAALPDVSFFSVVRQKLKWSGSSIGPTTKPPP
jgi:NAD+ kinase